MLKTESCHDANFVNTGGIVGGYIMGYNGDLWSLQWQESWHHDDSWFSMQVCGTVVDGDSS